MSWYTKLSFIAKVGLAMLLSLGINIFIEWSLKSRLGPNDYVLELDIEYAKRGGLELLFDTGANFNQEQRESVAVIKGKNSLKIPFSTRGKGQLKYLRLDFGKDTALASVALNKLGLSNNSSAVFQLENNEIYNHIGLFQGVDLSNQDLSTLQINHTIKPFDPYIVFSPINELAYPKWQRILCLVIPWIIVLLSPLVKWIKKRFAEQEYAELLTALVLISIPLKPAWVTFSTVLLLGYAIVLAIKRRKIVITPIHYALIGLFLVPLFLIGDGRVSKLGIPLGFILIPLIGSLADLSHTKERLLENYTKVFFVLMSIILCYWILLISYEGYFYGIHLQNYFADLKTNSNRVLYWLYYRHTTFLGFFMIIGGLFCFELFKNSKVSKTYFFGYALFMYLNLLLLGSRFTLGIALLLPFLIWLPNKPLGKVLVGVWGLSLFGSYTLITRVDVFRSRLWNISIDKILEKPWFGHGTGSSELLLPETLPILSAGIETEMKINHPHNQYITYLLENGILGAVLAVGLLLYIGYRFYKEQNKTMLLIIFSVMLLMLVESPFRTTTALYGIVFVLAVLSFSSGRIAVKWDE